MFETKSVKLNEAYIFIVCTNCVRRDFYVEINKVLYEQKLNWL